MVVTIETFLVPGVALPPEDYDRCRNHYARERGCRDPRNGQVGGKHLSQDIWALEGTPIVAPCDGNMRYISTAGDYGNWGKFQSHRTGKGIWIAHCRDRLKTGEFKRGQEIGKVGTTGTQSTGPHCHAELHPVWNDFNSVERIWPELQAALVGREGDDVGGEYADSRTDEIIQYLQSIAAEVEPIGNRSENIERWISESNLKVNLEAILRQSGSAAGDLSDEDRDLIERHIKTLVESPLNPGK